MDFENLHQILRSLYDEMMPLCSDMTDIAKGLGTWGAVLCRPEGLAVTVKGRADRRISAAPSVCHRTCHHVLPDHRARYAQQRDESHRARYTFHVGDTDLRHEWIPGAERQVGVWGDETQSGNRIPCEQRGVWQAAWRTRLVTRRRGDNGRNVWERGMYSMKKEHPWFLPWTAGAAVPSRCTGHRRAEDILPHRPVHPRTALFRHIGMGRIPVHADAMVLQVHTDLSLATVSDLFSTILPRYRCWCCKTTSRHCRTTRIFPLRQTTVFTFFSSSSESSVTSPYRPWRDGSYRQVAASATTTGTWTRQAHWAEAS